MIEEFTEWMEYFAGRDHVVKVATELAALLAEEICAGTPEAAPAGFPLACGTAFLAAGVDRPTLPPRLAPSALDAAEDAYWRIFFATQWRDAATAGRARDLAFWANEGGRAARHSRRFAVKRARLGGASQDSLADRRRRIAAVSDLLFSRLWDRRADQLLQSRFRKAFCARSGGTPGVLATRLKTELRDGGSHSLHWDDDKGEWVPAISGTTIRRVTRLLHLSDRVRLAARIEQLPGWNAAEADPAAAMLVEKRADPALLTRLCQALAAPGRQPTPSLDAARRTLEALIDAAQPGADPREDRTSRPHAAAVFMLCRGDQDLPQKLVTVEDYLRRFGGSARAALSLDQRLGEDPDAPELGEFLKAPPSGPGPDTDSLGEELLRIFSTDPTMAAAARRRFDVVFPDTKSRIRGALLLGMPFLLPKDTQEPTRLLAQHPPRNTSEWNRLARILRSTVPALRAEEKDLLQKLAHGWKDR